MSNLDGNFTHDEIDHDEISRMIDDLFVSHGDDAKRWSTPSMAPAAPSVGDGADHARRRALRAFGHQIRLTRRAAGYRTTGDLAFAMRAAGLKITGAMIGNWERGFVLPDPQALEAAEQLLRSEGVLADTLAELIGNDEAEIDPEQVGAAPDVHTRLRIEDLETRVADLEDEVAALRQRPTRLTPPAAPSVTASPAPAAARSWLSRLRTAPTHHHSGGGSWGHDSSHR